MKDKVMLAAIGTVCAGMALLMIPGEPAVPRPPEPLCGRGIDVMASTSMSEQQVRELGICDPAMRQRMEDGRDQLRREYDGS